MAGDRLMRVEFNDRKVRRGLQKLEERRKGLVKAFRSLRKPLREDLVAHANRESGPDGRWERRAASTQARLTRTGPAKRTRTVRERRRRGRSGPLRETRVTTTYGNLLGTLPSSVGVSTKKRGPTLIARSAGPMAAAHNEGAVVGHGARIPAREFVFISDPLKSLALDTMEKFVMDGWHKA